MVEERVQRRLAAILAADVVGYSRLMGEDEEGTLATLKAYRATIDSSRRGDARSRESFFSWRISWEGSGQV